MIPINRTNSQRERKQAERSRRIAERILAKTAVTFSMSFIAADSAAPRQDSAKRRYLFSVAAGVPPAVEPGILPGAGVWTFCVTSASSLSETLSETLSD